MRGSKNVIKTKNRSSAKLEIMKAGRLACAWKDKMCDGSKRMRGECVHNMQEEEIAAILWNVRMMCKNEEMKQVCVCVCV